MGIGMRCGQEGSQRRDLLRDGPAACSPHGRPAPSCSVYQRSCHVEPSSSLASGECVNVVLSVRDRVHARVVGETKNRSKAKAS